MFVILKLEQGHRVTHNEKFILFLCLLCLRCWCLLWLLSLGCLLWLFALGCLPCLPWLPRLLGFFSSDPLELLHFMLDDSVPLLKKRKCLQFISMRRARVQILCLNSNSKLSDSASFHYHPLSCTVSEMSNST